MKIEELDIEIIKQLNEEVFTAYGLSKKMKVYEEFLKHHLKKLCKAELILKNKVGKKWIYIANKKRVIIKPDLVLLKMNQKTEIVVIFTMEKSKFFKNVMKILK